MNNPPSVSVVMITYDQEEYIRQAVLGVLKQEYKGEVELIISNDNSPDNTDAIIRDIINNHPKSNWIKYSKNTRNMGMMPNFINALKQATGKYIAICDGDDFWTNSNKIEKQVKFLEENQDFSITGHVIGEYNTNTNKIERVYPSIFNKNEFTISDLAKNNFIPCLSVVFKNNFREFPIWIEHSTMGDYPLHMYNAQFGKIKMFTDVMANYRLAVGSYNSLHSTKKRINQLKTIADIQKNLTLEKKVYNNLQKHKENLLLSYYKNKVKHSFFKESVQLLKGGNYYKQLKPNQRLIIFLKKLIK